MEDADLQVILSYISDGVSIQQLAERRGLQEWDIKEILRGNGFCHDKSGKFSEHDRGMYKRGNYTKSLSLIVEEFSDKYGYCSPLFSDYIKKYELSECKLQTREVLDAYLEEVYDFVVYGKGMLPNTRGKFSESDRGKYIYLSTNKKSMSYLRGYLSSNFSNFGDYVHEVVTSSKNMHDYYIENLIASGHTFEEG